MKCNNCGSRSIEIDYTKGNSFCIDCGYVAEEDHVVAEVTFDNTKVVGTFISDNQSGPSFLKNRHGNYICDSRQYRLNKAYQEIQSIAEKLSKLNNF